MLSSGKRGAPVTALAGLALFLASGLLIATTPALGQGARPSDDCILDRCQDRLDRQGTQARPDRQVQPDRQAPQDRQARPSRRDEPAPDASEVDTIPGLPRSGSSRPSGVAQGDFDFYVLALSWSSGFCELSGNGRNSRQCDGGANLGFVVHGLWPQNERGFPADCPGVRTPSRQALELTRGVFPDEGLARYEWRKHGTCSGRSPTEYFADVKRARESIVIPAQFENLREPVQMAPAEIQRAFTEANPRLRPGMLAVGCPKGVLQEVRICMTKDLRSFRPCPEVANKTCRGRGITVPPIL